MKKLIMLGLMCFCVVSLALAQDAAVIAENPTTEAVMNAVVEPAAEAVVAEPVVEAVVEPAVEAVVEPAAAVVEEAVPAVEAAVAEPAVEAPVVQSMTLKGDIIDNKCAGTQKPKELAEFVKTHPKACALAPDCVASGYSIFVDGKLMKFDDISNPKIEEFLKNENSKLQVSVIVKDVKGLLSLESIANQE